MPPPWPPPSGCSIAKRCCSVLESRTGHQCRLKRLTNDFRFQVPPLSALNFPLFKKLTRQGFRRTLAGMMPVGNMEPRISFPRSRRGDEAPTHCRFPISDFGLSLLTSAATREWERTPLACSFRRRAGNLVSQTFLRQLNDLINVTKKFGRDARTDTRDACAPQQSDYEIA